MNTLFKLANSFTILVLLLSVNVLVIQHASARVLKQNPIDHQHHEIKVNEATATLKQNPIDHDKLHEATKEGMTQKEENLFLEAKNDRNPTPSSQSNPTCNIPICT